MTTDEKMKKTLPGLLRKCTVSSVIYQAELADCSPTLPTKEMFMKSVEVDFLQTRT